MKIENFKFTVIGGGTGTYSVLTGLKKYTKNISAIVTMADSGGSAKKERDEWGLLPSSDVRKSLIALSNVSTRNLMLLRKLFQYRYSEGEGIRGMSFGNLLLIALTKLLGSQPKAIKKAGELLNIRGRVIPISLDKVDLVAKYTDGTQVIGEHFIDEPIHDGKTAIKNLYTKPQTEISEDAKGAIYDSDAIIIGPGGFYTTILANFVVKGTSRAVYESRAKKIFILNLMTEYGQTYKFSASKFLEEFNKYYPIDNLDYVLLNKAPIPDKVLWRYRKFHAEQVINDLGNNTPFRVISENLLSSKVIRREKGDTLFRSLIRHDPEKIVNSCMKILDLI